MYQILIYKDWQLNSLNEYISATTSNIPITDIHNSIIFISYDFYKNTKINTITKITNNNNILVLASDFDAVLMMMTNLPENVYQLIDGVPITKSTNTFIIHNEFMCLYNTIENAKYIKTNARTATFFTLMGRDDIHRDILVNALSNANCLDKGLVIYHTPKNLSKTVCSGLSKQHKNDNFYKDFEFPEHDRHWHDADAKDVYYEYYNLEIVTETTVNAHFLTEKTIKPLASKMPFLMVSSAGYLKYLRSLGFKTFGGIFDESYDDIVDIHQRINAVTNLLVDLIASKKIHTLVDQCSEILNHNAQHVVRLAQSHTNTKKTQLTNIINLINNS